MENKNNRFNSAISVLSTELYSALSEAPPMITENAQEIILRANRPMCVECYDKRYYFTKNRCITDTILEQQMLICSSRSMFDTFQNICNYSVYSRQNEINNGYITLKGGHRAGVCGTAVTSDSKIVNVKNITSINIRIARELVGCSDKLCSAVSPLGGVLICGAPCSGKTTIIRDYARKLSYDYKVSVVDERNELSSNVSGVFQNDMGLCDVFDSYVKCDAIIQAVRSMSPDIIVCDEISTLDDVNAVSYGVNCGVSFIATLHADDVHSLLNRSIGRSLLKTGAFSQIVFLDTRANAGRIKNVISIDEIGGELND